MEQEIETDDKSTERIRNLGLYAVNGGPGRPPGLKNKFTQVKEALVDVFFEGNGKEAFKKTLLMEDGTINLEALRAILSVLPKEIEDHPENHFSLLVSQLRAYSAGELRNIISSFREGSAIEVESSENE